MCLPPDFPPKPPSLRPRTEDEGERGEADTIDAYLPDFSLRETCPIFPTCFSFPLHLPFSPLLLLSPSYCFPSSVVAPPPPPTPHSRQCVRSPPRSISCAGPDDMLASRPLFLSTHRHTTSLSDPPPTFHDHRIDEGSGNVIDIVPLHSFPSAARTGQHGRGRN